MAESLSLELEVDLDKLRAGLAEAVAAVRAAAEEIKSAWVAALQSIDEVASAPTVVRPPDPRRPRPEKRQENIEKENQNDQKQTSNQNDKADDKKRSEERRRGIFDSLQRDVSRGFSQAFNRVLRDGLRFRDAMADIARDVSAAFVDAAAQLAINWLRTQIEMTLASEGQAAVRGTVGATEAGASSAISVSSTIGSILNDAARAAAAFASIAAIPIFGPALAPGAAAAAYGATAAFAGAVVPFAERGFDVPADTLAYLHKDEMVLPAALAERIRGLSDPRGRAPSGPTIGQVVIHATDADSFRRMLRRNPGAIADAMMAAHRGFKPMKV
ncbi:MAG TPA: hypothetical protein VJ924_11890 [Alphaproteobacteria bacterium]|nr:hypothetical protein [Alphaproteobacteria bacterium]